MNEIQTKTKRQLWAEMQEAARQEQFEEITGLRQQLLVTLKELDPDDTRDSYTHSLTAMVRVAGKNGIELSRVKEILPDPDVLQQVRNQLGSDEYVTNKGTPQEEKLMGEKVILEGKGQTKGNTITLYPGEKMNLKVNQNQPPVPEIKPSTPDGTPANTPSTKVEVAA